MKASNNTGRVIAKIDKSMDLKWLAGFICSNRSYPKEIKNSANIRIGLIIDGILQFITNERELIDLYINHDYWFIGEYGDKIIIKLEQLYAARKNLDELFIEYKELRNEFVFTEFTVRAHFVVFRRVIALLPSDRRIKSFDFIFSIWAQLLYKDMRDELAVLAPKTLKYCKSISKLKEYYARSYQGKTGYNNPMSQAIIARIDELKSL